MSNDAAKLKRYEETLKLLADTSIASYLRSITRNEEEEPTMEVTLTACDITAFAKLDNALAAFGIKPKVL
jgi:hypothetical protein